MSLVAAPRGGRIHLGVGPRRGRSHGRTRLSRNTQARTPRHAGGPSMLCWLALCAPTAEPPMMGRRVAARLLLGSSVLAKPLTAACDAPPLSADLAYAIAEMAACRTYVGAVLNRVRADDFETALPQMSRPPLSNFGTAALAVAAASNFDAVQKEAIESSRSRVLDNLSTMKTAIRAQEKVPARTAAKAAQAELDVILSTCTEAGLL